MLKVIPETTRHSGMFEADPVQPTHYPRPRPLRKDPARTSGCSSRYSTNRTSLYKHFPHRQRSRSRSSLTASRKRRSIRCGGPTRSARSRRPTGLSQRRIPRLSVGDERPLPREQLPKGWMPAARRGCSVPLATRPRARAACAFMHGLTLLERNDRLPADELTEPAWRIGVEQF